VSRKPSISLRPIVYGVLFSLPFWIVVVTAVVMVLL